MTTTLLGQLPAGELTIDQLRYLLADRRARAENPGPTHTDEVERIRQQAAAARVAFDMVVEDGFPGALVVDVVAGEFPAVPRTVIADIVAGAVAELASR